MWSSTHFDSVELGIGSRDCSMAFVGVVTSIFYKKIIRLHTVYTCTLIYRIKQLPHFNHTVRDNGIAIKSNFKCFILCARNYEHTISEDVWLEDVTTPTILQELPVIQIHGLRGRLIIESH